MLRPSPPPFRRLTESASGASKRCTASGSMPTPLSLTLMQRSTPGPLRVPSAEMITRPPGANRIALPTRLISTCRKRPVSPITHTGVRSLIRASSTVSFARACGSASSATSEIATRRSNADSSSCSEPASSFERSSTSVTKVIRTCAERMSDSTYPFCAGDSGVSASRWAMPTTPLIGVRNSVLITVRNSVCCFLARSTSTRASRNASSASFRVPASSRTTVKIRRPPDSPLPTRTSIAISSPSARRPLTSREAASRNAESRSGWNSTEVESHRSIEESSIVVVAASRRCLAFRLARRTIPRSSTTSTPLGLESITTSSSCSRASFACRRASTPRC